MYAECPNCHAIFRVTPEILAKAQGKVRCGECQTVFQAHVEEPPRVDSVVEYAESKPRGELVIEDHIDTEGHVQPPEDLGYADDLELDDPSVVEQALKEEVQTTEAALDDAPTTEHGTPSTDIKNGVEDYGSTNSQDPSGQTSLFSDDSPEVSKTDSAETTAPEKIPAETAVATETARRGLWHNTVFLTILALLFLTVLAGQYLYKARYEWAQVPSVRPALEQLCKVAKCDLPPRVSLARLELLNHGIYSHPNEKGALMIKAVIVNHADFSQPLPIVELSLSNIRGEKMALRRFTPNEYLSNADNLDNGLMPSETNISIALQVKDPGKDALAFEFEFL